MAFGNRYTICSARCLEARTEVVVERAEAEAAANLGVNKDSWSGSGRSSGLSYLFDQFTILLRCFWIPMSYFKSRSIIVRATQTTIAEVAVFVETEVGLEANLALVAHEEDEGAAGDGGGAALRMICPPRWISLSKCIPSSSSTSLEIVGVTVGGYASPGFRGRGIGSPVRGGSGYNSPVRGTGYDSPPRGRGRGRGDNFDSPRGGRGGAWCSQTAVRCAAIEVTGPGTTEEEELLQAAVEDVDDTEQSHVPTADRVTRVFSGGTMPRIESSEDEEEEGEETLEEIDFDDLGKLREEVDAAAAALPDNPVPAATVEVVEERFTGIFINKPQQTTVDSPMPDAAAEAFNHVVDAVESTSATELTHDDVRGDITVQLSVDATVPEPMLSVAESAPIVIFELAPTAVAEPTPIAVADPTPIAIVAVSESTPVVAPDSAPDGLSTVTVESAPTATDAEPLFYIDTTPTPLARAPGAVEAALAPLHAYPTSSDDEEVIVYDAPNPRAGRSGAASPAPPVATTSVTIINESLPVPPPFASVSFAPPTPSPKKQPARRQPPVFTVRGHAKAQTKARALAKRVAKRAAAASSFKTTRAKDERRRGDSDVDWGDEDSDDDDGEDEGGMAVDGDLDAAAMARFAKGMGQEGGRWVTMDDVDAIVDAEEALMIAEPADLRGDEEEDSDEEDDDEDSDENDQSPKSGFQAQLERLRKAARDRGPDDSLELMEMEFSDEDEDYEFLNKTWAERDQDFASEIQAILDENGDILSARSRQGRKKLLKAVVDGEISDFEGFKPAKRGKKKRNDIPPELQDKAENKRLRALARAEAAADPLGPKKGGKKGRKAMLAAARLDPTITVIPNRIIDLPTLVQQIRRFVGDIGGPQSMALPPSDKETRKNVHELALAFGLKSVSKGKGEARYTTLTKTTRSGIRVDEGKVAKVVRRAAGGRGGGAFVKYDGGDKGKGRVAAMPRHKDGDEVGKAAPKIGETNIGFKMLALMGWAEGERIGASADGLHAPLTAVIKNTKLGLGATR
ncbi:hypothetical protein MVEN_00845400 [Mycena venus]|uniref:Protein SQS1 n=1 Tax=Mycena venus TaxID=2733690 RepID=A0A8H7D0Z8_9AGAR|nr:hypothetical protein MVEN_00845400 [Mycena venus]